MLAKLSPKKRFHEIGQTYRTSRDYRPEPDDHLLERLGSDIRMVSVWGKLNELSDTSYVHVVEFVLLYYSGCQTVSLQIESLRERSEQLAVVRSALDTFRRACLLPIGRSIPSYVMGVDSHASIADSCSLTLPALQQIETHVDECERKYRKEVNEISVCYGRKTASAGRVEFMCEIAALMTEAFGQPLYELVATVTNVLFNTDDENSVNADVVKAARIRARERLGHSINFETSRTDPPKIEHKIADSSESHV